MGQHTMRITEEVQTDNLTNNILAVLQGLAEQNDDNIDNQQNEGINLLLQAAQLIKKENKNGIKSEQQPTEQFIQNITIVEKQSRHPLQCKECNKRFEKRCYLKRHIQSAHSNESKSHLRRSPRRKSEEDRSEKSRSRSRSK